MIAIALVVAGASLAIAIVALLVGLHAYDVVTRQNAPQRMNAGEATAMNAGMEPVGAFTNWPTVQ